MYDAFDWDESKAAGNERKHGLALADGAEAMRSARFWLIRQDTRYDYGERRYQCIVADPRAIASDLGFAERSALVRSGAMGVGGFILNVSFRREASHPSLSL